MKAIGQYLGSYKFNNGLIVLLLGGALLLLSGCGGGSGGEQESDKRASVAASDPSPQPDQDPVDAPPVVSLNASETEISENGSVTLSWSSTNANTCEASGDWSGSRVASGSMVVGPLSSTSTFTLTCSGTGGSINNSVVVTVNQQGAPTLQPTVSLTADSTSIAYNGTVALSWSSTNATSCSAGGGWSGNRSTSGNLNVGPLTSSQAFSLTCSGDGGTASDSITVAVAAPRPTVSLTANPTSIAYNGTVVLSWSSANATSCSASGGWSGSRSTSGNLSVGPLTATQTFSLTCSGNGGTASDAITVTVASQAAAPTVSLNAAATVLGANDATTLSWSSNNATSCTASGAWSGGRSTSGSTSVGPISADQTYTLSCTGAGGTALASLTITYQTSTLVSTTLNWSSPTTRVDGSTLSASEVGGYKIYYGTVSGNYTNVVDVTDGSATSYTINNLTAGVTYYFAMSAYDSFRDESAVSLEISRDL